jgi:hypothetical protein
MYIDGFDSCVLVASMWIYVFGSDDDVDDLFDPQHPPLWTPPDTIGHAPRLFRFQLPCSWGAVYNGRAWRAFKQFYRLRLRLEKKSNNDGGRIFPGVPGLASHQWRLSWKRYSTDISRTSLYVDTIPVTLLFMVDFIVIR